MGLRRAPLGLACRSVKVAESIGRTASAFGAGSQRVGPAPHLERVTRLRLIAGDAIVVLVGDEEPLALADAARFSNASRAYSSLRPVSPSPPYALDSVV